MNDAEKYLHDEFEAFFSKVFAGASSRQKMDIMLTFYAGAWRAATGAAQGLDAKAVLDAAYRKAYLFYEQSQKDIQALDGKKPQ